MSRTAFVTGGTGFIGLNLIEQLVQEGWQVTALHRPASNLEYLQRFPVALVTGSITEPATLEQAIPTGTNVVFHLAGSTNQWSKRNVEQTAINVDGTRHMVEAAVRKEVPTFIHTSSVAAWGRAKGTIDEATPQQGATSWINYERSKWAGEQEALKGVEKGMKVVVLNPAGVAGPYDAQTWGRLFFLMRDGKLPGTPPGDGSFNHVHEVVRAHISAVERGRGGQRYILGGEDTSFPEVFQEIARLLDISKTPPRLPAMLIRTVARLSAFAANFTGKEPDITPEGAAITTGKGVRYSSDKAIAELGYRLRPWTDAFRDCYEWLKAEGKL